jgi:hypothetical protein
VIKLKIELDELEVLNLLVLVKDEFKKRQDYFSNFPNEAKGLQTPEEIELIYNKILAIAKEGVLYNLING